MRVAAAGLGVDVWRLGESKRQGVGAGVENRGLEDRKHRQQPSGERVEGEVEIGDGGLNVREHLIEVV